MSSPETNLRAALRAGAAWAQADAAEAKREARATVGSASRDAWRRWRRALAFKAEALRLARIEGGAA